MCRIINHYVEKLTLFRAYYKFRHNLTANDIIRHNQHCTLYTRLYFPAKCRSWYELVKVLEILSKLVKATFSLHYHYTLIYENYSKNRSTNSDKIRIIYYSMIHLKCQELFIASFPIIRHNFYAIFFDIVQLHF